MNIIISPEKTVIDLYRLCPTRQSYQAKLQMITEWLDEHDITDYSWIVVKSFSGISEVDPSEYVNLGKEYDIDSNWWPTGLMMSGGDAIIFTLLFEDDGRDVYHKIKHL